MVLSKPLRSPFERKSKIQSRKKHTNNEKLIISIIDEAIEFINKLYLNIKISEAFLERVLTFLLWNYARPAMILFSSLKTRMLYILSLFQYLAPATPKKE